MNTCIESRRGRAARRGQRGAVMLEAVIVALVLITMFFCVVGLGGLYRAKLRAMQDARFRDTLNATNSCRVTGPSLLAFAFPEMDGEPATPSDPIQGLRDVARMAVPGVGGGVSRAHAHASFAFVPGPNPVVQGLHGTVTSDSVSACNPIAIDLGPLELASELKNELSSAMSSIFGN